MSDNQGGHQGKIEDFLAELELKHLKGPKGSSYLNPGFSTRLDEFAKSVFEDSSLTQNFTTELRYGMGSALGHKLVETLWEDLSPSLGDSASEELDAEIRIYLPENQLSYVRANWNKTAVTFTRESGVLLPRVEFEQFAEPIVYLKALELGTFSESLEPQDANESILEILKENAWRFLTFDQVSDKLRELWSRKPKFHRAAREERVPLRTFVFVLRHLLKGGVPIVDLDIIMESLFLNMGLDDLSVIAENVLNETEELICGKKEPEPKKRTAQDLSIVDEMTLELGHQLAPYMDTSKPRNLVVAINKTRRWTARDFGWVMPTVNLRVNYDLPPGACRVLVRGVEAFACDIGVDRLFVTGALKALRSVKGEGYRDPVYGVPAKWIDESQRAKAEKAGLLVIDPMTFITALVNESAISNAHKLFTYEAFEDMLDALKHSNLSLVKQIRDSAELSAMAKKTIHNLLRERVPIIDKNTILETIVHHRYEVNGPFFLTELVRLELKGVLCKEFLEERVPVEAIRLSAEFENELETRIFYSADSGFLKLEKTELAEITKLFQDAADYAAVIGSRPLLITSIALRPVLWKCLAASISKLVVLSTAEVVDGLEIRDLKTVDYRFQTEPALRIW